MPWHIGIDQCAPMFAPCLLGCPGTLRQHPVPAVRRRCGRPGQNGSLPARAIISSQQFKEHKRTEKRTLNPRVRGSSPWRRTRFDLGFYHPRAFFMCPFCPRVCSREDRAADSRAGRLPAAPSRTADGRRSARDQGRLTSRASAMPATSGLGRRVEPAGRRAVKPVTSTEWPACIFVWGKACNVRIKLRSLAGPSVKSAVA
jgi:hypothetical protein